MTTTDNELYELCKNIHDVTRWEPKSLETHYFQDNDTPLYISDYLLEKLPYEVSVHVAGLEVTSNGLGDSRNWLGEWVSGSGKKRINSGIADTPLKALLKLTLAVHKAGELK
ncbi:MAG: hypothetical protein JWR59_2501 [Brevundimonas sp.]|nr:hypothetical protein [Brevundimonas sp.]